jgi:ribonucleotide monophosphatase NagD (HAD superfamily)
VPAERIVLAGELAVRQLAREHPGARVLMAASPALQRFARSLGCEQVQAAPTSCCSRSTCSSATRASRWW